MSKLIKNFSVELTKDEISSILVKVVEEETRRKVLSVRFNISGGYEDRYQYTTADLTSVVIQLGDEIKDDKQK